MGPFSQRSPERLDQDPRNRLERDFPLKATYDDEVSPSNNRPTEEYVSQPLHPREERDIRNLGFFREQERQFTQTEDEEEWQERQSPINFVLISGIFIILCVIGWFGYRWASQMHSGEPPVIAAEMTPIKIRPENPGGMVIPHQDKLVYGRISPDQNQPVEHLLPAPEQLMSPPAPQPPQQQPQTFVDANGQVFYAYPVPAQQPSTQQQYPEQQPQLVDPNNGYSQPQNYYVPPTAYQQQPQQQQMMPASPRQHGSMQQQAPAQGYQPQNQPTYAPTPAHQQAQPMQAQPQPMPAPGMSAPGMPPSPPSPRGHMIQPAQQPAALPMTNVAPAALPAESDKDMLDQLIEKELSPTRVVTVNPEKPTQQKAKIVVGPYKIQVATVDNKESAIKEVKRIRNIDTRLFSDKKIFAQEISSMGTKKPSYRVIIDGFSTPNAAAQFSNKLKIHKVKGIVLHQPN